MRLPGSVLLLLSLALLFASRTEAQGISETTRWVHISGYTHHFAAPNANDNLFGLGLTWHAQRYGRFTAAWEADAFRDSGRKLSAYLGQSLIYRFNALSVGATGALMYHRNFLKHNRWGLMPVALPFVETHGERLKLRFYYVPPVRRASDQQIAVQMLVGWP